jgi:hypothetical protein
MRKLLSAGIVFAVMAALLISAPGTGALGAPPTNPAVTNASYTTCFRVFSDPHAYWPAPTQPSPDRSPYAKGAAQCAATDFYSYTDVFYGNGVFPPAMTFLENLFPRFIEVYNLEQDFGEIPRPFCANSADLQDLCSAGLPRQGTPTDRVKSDLFLVRVTDETVAETNKKLFAFPLSIHGIERAGAEAGVRAIEDLATWGYCEARLAGEVENGLTNCAMEGPIPHQLLETRPAGADNLTAGAVLKDSSIYFVFANADGWRRGDPDNAVRFFQRYNGNGVDLNRDWPTQGFTNRPYTPWSEPESRAFGKVLREISPNWAGGIDLHGQLSGRAFSFTLLGAGQHDYAKDQRILQVVKGAWVDAEARLGWHPQIIPNTAPPPTCSGPLPSVGTVCANQYGVQWGTVWDTINYQITGGFGDWIDNPEIGLGGDGIDNEMSYSHLSNCGVGTCYLIDFEQLHVDGNKSLVYAMMNYTLLPEDTHFEVPGKVGYIFNPTVLSHPGTSEPSPPPALSPQPNQTGILLTPSPTPADNYVHRFEIFGPDSPTPYYNGGVEGKITQVNVGGVSPGSVTSSLVLEYLDPELSGNTNTACNVNGDKWNEVNTYFNQSFIYLQGGQAVHANEPEPGQYRICMTGGLTTADDVNASPVIELEINYSTEKAWENPGQLPYSVTNMKFFEDLGQYMDPGQIVPIQVSDVVSGPLNLMQFTSIVVADNPAPGLTPGSPEMTAYKDKVLNFVKRGGNLVLTDGALQLLGDMGFVAPGNIARHHEYAGYIGFTRTNGDPATYNDPLAQNINQPGAAEGDNPSVAGNQHRHQTYEPVPLGFDIGSRQSCSGQPPPTGPTSACTSPVWTVLQSAWEAPLQGSNSRTVGQIQGNTTGNRAGFGELTFGCGRVRIIGALLPMPTERYFHPFGLANYAVTYSGYQVLKNTLQWNRPRVTSRRTSIPNPC